MMTVSSTTAATSANIDSAARAGHWPDSETWAAAVAWVRSHDPRSGGNNYVVVHGINPSPSCPKCHTDNVLTINTPPQNPREWNLLAHAILARHRRQLGRNNILIDDDNNHNDDHHHAEVIRWLIQRHAANPWQTSGYLSWTAWELVVWHNQVSVLQVLVQHCLTEPPQQETTATTESISGPSQQQQQQTEVLNRALRMALELGHWKAAQLLLPYESRVCVGDANTDDDDDMKGNALHWTCAQAYRLFQVASIPKTTAMNYTMTSHDVEQWLPTNDTDDADGDENNGNSQNDTNRMHPPYEFYTHQVIPFLLQEYRKLGVLQMKLQEREIINSNTGTDGRTPWHCVGPFVSIAQAFVKATITDRLSLQLPHSVLHSAVRFPRVLQFWLSCLDSNTSTWVSFSLRHNHRSADTVTPLQYACKLGALTSMKLLMGRAVEQDALQALLLTPATTSDANDRTLDVLYTLVQNVVARGFFVMR